MRFSDLVCILHFGDDAEFEQEHDRDKNGRFSSGGSTGSTTESKEGAEKPSGFDRQKFEELIGPEFKGVRRQAAVRKLLEEKRGHVKAAFHRKDIGDIDLVWGNDQVGLCHILKRRGEQGINSEEFARDLSEIVQEGEIARDDERNTFRIWKSKKEVVVTRVFRGKNVQLVITAFPSRKKPKIFKSQALKAGPPSGSS